MDGAHNRNKRIRKLRILGRETLRDRIQGLEVHREVNKTVNAMMGSLKKQHSE